jgi:hypothetical protein
MIAPHDSFDRLPIRDQKKPRMSGAFFIGQIYDQGSSLADAATGQFQVNATVWLQAGNDCRACLAEAVA